MVISRLSFLMTLFFFVLGLSHVLRAQQWSELFQKVLRSPLAGLLVGAYTLPLGLLIVFFHNRWDYNLGLILTIIGWLLVLKASLYLLRPDLAQMVLRFERLPKSFFSLIGALLILAAAINLFVDLIY